MQQRQTIRTDWLDVYFLSPSLYHLLLDCAFRENKRLHLTLMIIKSHWITKTHPRYKPIDCSQLLLRLWEGETRSDDTFRCLLKMQSICHFRMSILDRSIFDPILCVVIQKVIRLDLASFVIVAFYFLLVSGFSWGWGWGWNNLLLLTNCEGDIGSLSLGWQMNCALYEEYLKPSDETVKISRNASWFSFLFKLTLERSREDRPPSVRLQPHSEMPCALFIQN